MLMFSYYSHQARVRELELELAAAPKLERMERLGHVTNMWPLIVADNFV